ncbi:MAG: LysR family transcriptional regulator [Burkholderiales bacterium]|nr:LysR family transcriptional regulator [Burkholderiales bacterium]
MLERGGYCVKSNNPLDNSEKMNFFNPKHLHAFATVVDIGSMARAAEKLHMGQPALSQAIAKLEELAGLTLIDRSTRRLSLTPAGKVFYENARAVVEQHTRLTAHLRQWSQAQEGTVCLMSIPSIAQRLIPRAVRDFGVAWPQVKIDIHDLPDRQLADEIRAGLGDVAIQTQGFEDETCRWMPMLHDPLRWVGSSQHRLAARREIGPRDLRGETLILLRKGSVFREMMEPLYRWGLEGEKFIEVDQPSTLLSMVAEGLGVALLPALFCPVDGRLVSRRWDEDRVARTILLTRPRGRALMPAQKNFVHFMLDQLWDERAELGVGVGRLRAESDAREQFLSDD